MNCSAKKAPKWTWRIQYRWGQTGTGTNKENHKKRGFKAKKEGRERMVARFSRWQTVILTHL